MKDRSGQRPRGGADAGPQGRTESRTSGGGLQPPTCPSAAAGSGWQPANHVDGAPGPAPAPARAPAPPRPRSRAPPPPTHYASPRPPGLFKLGPYHQAGRGRPGRSGWRVRAQRAASPRAMAASGARLSPFPPPPPRATWGPARAPPHTRTHPSGRGRAPAPPLSAPP